MRIVTRITAVTALAGAIALGGGQLAPSPAQAVTPIDGISGCYWYDWYDYGYVFHGLAGYCLGGDSGSGPIEFDFDGNYGPYGTLGRT